jgi:hypothetical protein
MSSVFVTTYEAVGDGVAIVERYLEKKDAHIQAGMAVAEQFGASGFRPSRHGSPRTLLFNGNSMADTPEGFRYVGRVKADSIECAPFRNTKRGKEAYAALQEIGPMPNSEEVAVEFGWHPPEMPMDGTTVYFATASSVALPAPRHFIRLPRFARDQWEQPATLVAIPESEFMRAIEDHNAAARAMREADELAA